MLNSKAIGLPITIVDFKKKSAKIMRYAQFVLGPAGSGKVCTNENKLISPTQK